MQAEKFEQLVRRLEAYSRVHPTRYRLKVAALAVAGYACILGAIVLLLLIFAGFLAASVVVYLAWLTLPTAIAAAWIAVLVVRALWVRSYHPEGFSITPAEAPVLFEEIEVLRCRLEVPRVHEVLVDDDFNAALVQTPRLGIFGWQKNALVLGLTLMEAMPPDEFQSVIVHELAHLSGNHGRFGGWIYRVRQSWVNFALHLQNNKEQRSAHFQGLAEMFIRFVDWYVPYFDAYSSVVFRGHEYVADRCAGEVSGFSVRARSLLRTAIKHRYITEDYWPGVLKRADSDEGPPGDAFTHLCTGLRAGAGLATASETLDSQLALHTSATDSHPCLSERLDILEFQMPAGDSEDDRELLQQLTSPLEVSAAQHYLGTARKSFTARLDAQWKEHSQPWWQERHSYVKESRATLQRLETQAPPLSEDDSWNRARLTSELVGLDATKPLLEELLAASPTHVSAHNLLGLILLNEGNDAGLGHLQEVMARDPFAVLDCCQTAGNYLESRNRHEEAKLFRERFAHQQQLLANAERERASVSLQDRLWSVQLSDDVREALFRRLPERFPDVVAVYALTKEIFYLPQVPFCLVVVERKQRFLEWSPARNDGRLQDQIVEELKIPRIYTWVLSPQFTALWEKIKTVPGGELYRRPTLMQRMWRWLSLRIRGKVAETT